MGMVVMLLPRCSNAQEPRRILLLTRSLIQPIPLLSNQVAGSRVPVRALVLPSREHAQCRIHMGRSARGGELQMDSIWLFLGAFENFRRRNLFRHTPALVYCTE